MAPPEQYHEGAMTSSSLSARLNQWTRHLSKADGPDDLRADVKNALGQLVEWEQQMGSGWVVGPSGGVREPDVRLNVMDRVCRQAHDGLEELNWPQALMADLGRWVHEGLQGLDDNDIVQHESPSRAWIWNEVMVPARLEPDPLFELFDREHDNKEMTDWWHYQLLHHRQAGPEFYQRILNERDPRPHTIDLLGSTPDFLLDEECARAALQLELTDSSRLQLWGRIARPGPSACRQEALLTVYEHDPTMASSVLVSLDGEGHNGLEQLDPEAWGTILSRAEAGVARQIAQRWLGRNGERAAGTELEADRTTRSTT